MMPTLPNLRYEKKFIADGLTLPEALAVVRRHPSAFREIYPSRIVNNIYLDTPGRRDYDAHVNGAANRTKTRVRWYGLPSGLIERPALERKLKCGMVSGKETYGLPPLSLNGKTLRPVLKNAFDNAAFSPVLRSALHHLEPSLFNRYQRHYFLSRDGRFRLTVDSELQFGTVHTNNGSTFQQLFRYPLLIIELKYGADDAENAAFITNSLPFRMTRCSKYVLGIECRSAV